ncbi:uncharacterized protein G2W53_043919 [Senna tora]|uniref:Uncharacterized protein n=1 Tax=Senna tora TaxID=362788 RepID=A0A834SLJ1_9FABA|nr:uncharacterized protein G2W53_043919 [Senna tora]
MPRAVCGSHDKNYNGFSENQRIKGQAWSGFFHNAAPPPPETEIHPQNRSTTVLSSPISASPPTIPPILSSPSSSTPPLSSPAIQSSVAPTLTASALENASPIRSSLGTESPQPESTSRTRISCSLYTQGKPNQRLPRRAVELDSTTSRGFVSPQTNSLPCCTTAIGIALLFIFLRGFSEMKII